SRFLRFGSRPSVKLLNAVIGISPPFCESACDTLARLGLFPFRGPGRRGRYGHWKIRIPNIDDYLPCPVSLFFKELDVFAAVLDRLTAGVSHRLFVGAAHIGEISGLRYFNLGRLPTNSSARTRQHFFPGASNFFLATRVRVKVSLGRTWPSGLRFKPRCHVERSETSLIYFAGVGPKMIRDSSLRSE